MRKHTGFGPLAVLIALLLQTSSAGAAEKLTVMLDWFVNPDHAPLVVAREKGFFADAGLEVELIAPADPNDPPKLVAAGKADLAISYQPQLHLQVAEDLPLVRVGTLVATPLTALVALKDGPIHSIADLKGRKVGFSVGGFEDAVLGAMLAKHGLSLTDVTLVNVNFSLSPAILSGQVDAVIGAYRNFELNQMDLQGKPGRAFFPEENGVPAYDELIVIAHRDRLDDTRLRSFLDALERGVQYLINHPEESWNAFVGAYPALNDELNRRAWRDTLPRFALRPAALDRARYARFAAFPQGARADQGDLAGRHLRRPARLAMGARPAAGTEVGRRTMPGDATLTPIAVPAPLRDLPPPEDPAITLCIAQSAARATISNARSCREFKGKGMKKSVFAGAVAAAVGLLPVVALAAAGGGPGDAHAGGAPHLDGAALGLLWALPFAGMLLCIAVFPLVAPHFWEHNFGKVSAFWVVIVLWPFLLLFGWELTLFEVLHLALLEYLPFIILLLALFTVAGGIHFAGSFRGTPLSNTAFLAGGTVIASWTGTTGASMLLIRPVMRANKDRRHKVHVIIFFIFLVSNIGGSLTPLGDPPLFLGFLKGVSFFWPTVHVFLPMAAGGRHACSSSSSSWTPSSTARRALSRRRPAKRPRSASTAGPMSACWAASSARCC